MESVPGRIKTLVDWLAIPAVAAVLGGVGLLLTLIVFAAISR
jgi:hypothetical protein